MVATAVIVDLRRASKFAQHDDQGLLKQAAFGEIGSQRRQSRVHHFAVVTHRFEVVAMRIESASIDLHEPNTLLDQLLCNQTASTERCIAVAIHRFGFDMLQIKRLQRWASHQANRVFDGSLGRAEFLAGRPICELTIESAQDVQSLVAASLRDAFRKSEVRVFVSGRPNKVRFAALAQVAGAACSSADRNECGQVAELFLFVDDDRSKAWVP